MSTEKFEKSTLKHRLRNYINNLYKYLGEKYCFTSGAFVIKDPQEKLYKMLKGCSDRNLSDWYLASHTSLLKQSIEVQKTSASLRNFDNNVYECWLQDYLKYIMDCKCTQRPAENVKWYQFLGKDYALYIFLKLEDHPTINSEHLKQAVKRYIFSQPNESCKIPRREDCKKCDGQSKNMKECCGKFVNYQYTNFIIKGYDRGEIKETYGRVGDEVYVPAQISNFMLESDHVSMPEDHLTMIENPPDTIVIEENVITSRIGGQKQKTRRRGFRITRKRRITRTRKRRSRKI